MMYEINVLLIDGSIAAVLRIALGLPGLSRRLVAGGIAAPLIATTASPELDGYRSRFRERILSSHVNDPLGYSKSISI